MSPLASVRGQPAIAGFVTDAVTGKGLGGVCVQMAAMPPAFAGRMKVLRRAVRRSPEMLNSRPDRTESRADGLFFFTGLPDGNYEIRAITRSFGARYKSAKQRVAVHCGQDHRYQLNWTRLVLTPTLVTGVIKSGETLIAMADVRVQGSGESAFSDNEGKYAIAGMEPGKARRLLVLAQGFQLAQKPLVIEAAGTAVTVNFDLLPAPS
jgi:hypothetical protein